MKHFFLKATAFGVACALVQGCAPLGPGFSSPVGDAKQAVSPTGFSTTDIDAPPPGAITPITAELIRAERAAVPKTMSPEVMALIGDPEPAYRVGPGDVIGIVVYDHPEIVFSGVPATTVADPASVSPAPGFIVSSAGSITFPYVGNIHAAGLTIEELENTLTQRLSRVFKNPQLNVRVTAFRSKRAFVEGEVSTPGLMVFTDIPMTLAEALDRAGGIKPTGDRSDVQFTRNGVTTTLDLMAMADAGISPARIPLKNGDMINVRNRDERKVMVMGEVNQQMNVLMRNGRLSLSDALGEVGGVSLDNANPRQIYVIRNEPQGGQSIFNLDARTPTALALADGFALKPKDVVYVDRVPLVQWNRVINLILPTTTQATTIRQLSSPATP